MEYKVLGKRCERVRQKGREKQVLEGWMIASQKQNLAFLYQGASGLTLTKAHRTQYYEPFTGANSAQFICDSCGNS